MEERIDELVGDEMHTQMYALAQQIDMANLPSVLQTMQNCEKRKEWDNEKSHILADYLMIRLIEVEKPTSAEDRQLLQQIIASYKRGVEEVWWHA